MTTEMGKKIITIASSVCMAACVGIYAFYMKREDDRMQKAHEEHLATIRKIGGRVDDIKYGKSDE